MSSEPRHIVRIAGRDLEGRRKVLVALAGLKGVDMNFAHALLNALKFDERARLGGLSEQQVARIEEGLRDPSRLEMPVWLMNRRKDVDTGSNLHLIGADLDFTIKGDVDRERQVGSWRGIRHSLGLKVRGQRTRTTGRGGRTIGVKKVAAPR